MRVSKRVNGNGSRIKLHLEIKGDPVNDCYGAEVNFTFPNGVSLIGPSDPGSSVIKTDVGAYDPSGTIWRIGKLAAGALLNQYFEFRVDDAATALNGGETFDIVAVLDSTCDVLCADCTYAIEVTIDPDCDDSDLGIGCNVTIDGGYPVPAVPAAPVPTPAPAPTPAPTPAPSPA